MVTEITVRTFHHRVRDKLRPLLADLARDGKGWILLTVGAGWFVSIGVRYMYPSLLPFLREAFEFDLAVAGVLLSALWLAYAVGQFPGGVLGDRLGEGNILALSTGISAVAVLAVSLAFDLLILFAGTVAFGFATALYGTTRFTVFTDIYSDRAGTAVGLTMAAGSVGNTVLPAVAAVIAGYATWRLGFGLVVPVFVGITVAIWLTVPDRTGSHQGLEGER
jgi:MFS family permease